MVRYHSLANSWSLVNYNIAFMNCSLMENHTFCCQPTAAAVPPSACAHQCINCTSCTGRMPQNSVIALNLSVFLCQLSRMLMRRRFAIYASLCPLSPPRGPVATKRHLHVCTRGPVSSVTPPPQNWSGCTASDLNCTCLIVPCNDLCCQRSLQ